MSPMKVATALLWSDTVYGISLPQGDIGVRFF